LLERISRSSFNLKKLKIILLSLLIIYLASGLVIYLFQEKLIFLDGSIPEDYVYKFQYKFEELNLTTGDDSILNALHFKSEKSKGLIIYFHGNAGDLRRWGKVVEFYVDLGYDVLIMDYRGFGKSTGKRTQANLLSDAELFYQYALNDYSEDRITIFGRSLGTGIASYLASKHKPKQLILETPYYDFKSVVQRYSPIFPVGLALRFNFRSHEYLQSAECPIYIFHGTKDEVVPYRLGQKLAESISNNSVQLITVDGGKHKNLIDFEVFREAMRGILD
jgi:pimeloyl-ACP methyl ester carboxylesterase